MRQKFRGFRLIAVTHLRRNPCGRVYVAGIAAMCIRLAVVKSVDCSIAPQIPFSCRPRRRRKGRGSREAGETAGLPRGCESGQERSDAERGGGTPPADWGQQARSASAPLAGPGVHEVSGKTSAKHVIPRLRGHYLFSDKYADSLPRRDLR
jgi:hypothetical protein